MSAEDNHHVCGNCETAYEGNYCPQCGQSKVDINRPFSVLIIDLLGNMYAFDTRVFKTLKAELFKPWQITMDYIAGRRVRYMPPFRMYVFISIIFFLLLGSYTGKQLKEAQKKHTNEFLKIDLKSGEMNTGVKANATVSSTSPSADSLKQDLSENNNIEINADKATKDRIKAIKDNPELYISKFYNYLSWSLFLLMPFYALLTWLFFRRSESHYLGHFIFSICQHTFIFIILGILLIITMIFPHKTASPETWLLFTIPVYAITGMKKITGRKWISVSIKMLAIWILYFFAQITAIVVVAYLLFTF
jgi:hypothetical protein